MTEKTTLQIADLKKFIRAAKKLGTSKYNPILNCIAIYDSGGLGYQTDESGISTGSGDTDILAIVPLTQLEKLCRALKTGTKIIEVSADADTDRVTVGPVVIPMTHAIADYPDTPDYLNSADYDVVSTFDPIRAKLATVVKWTGNRSRFAFDGVQFSGDSIVATDGKRLIRVRHPGQQKIEVVVPTRAIHAILAAHTKGDSIMTMCKKDSAGIKMISGAYTVWAKALEGSFSKASRFILTNTGTDIDITIEILSADDFLTAVTMCAESKGSPVKLKSGQEISEIAGADSAIGFYATHSGPDTALNWNSAYLADILKLSPSDGVTLKLQSGRCHPLWHHIPSDNYTIDAVLMPMSEETARRWAR